MTNVVQKFTFNIDDFPPDVVQKFMFDTVEFPAEEWEKLRDDPEFVVFYIKKPQSDTLIGLERFSPKYDVQLKKLGIKYLNTMLADLDFDNMLGDMFMGKSLDIYVDMQKYINKKLSRIPPKYHKQINDYYQEEVKWRTAFETAKPDTRGWRMAWDNVLYDYMLMNKTVKSETAKFEDELKEAKYQKLKQQAEAARKAEIAKQPQTEAARKAEIERNQAEVARAEAVRNAEIVKRQQAEAVRVEALRKAEFAKQQQAEAVRVEAAQLEALRKAEFAKREQAEVALAIAGRLEAFQKAEFAKQQQAEAARTAEIARRRQEEINQQAEIAKQQAEIARQAEIKRKQAEEARAEAARIEAVRIEKVARLDEIARRQKELTDDEKEKMLSEIIKRYKKLDDENNMISNILEYLYKETNDNPNSNLVKQIDMLYGK